MPISFLVLRPATTLALMLAACAPGDRARAEAAQDSTPAARAAAPEPPRIPPLRTDSAGRAWAEQTLAGLSLRQRVAQLVFPWISGQSLAANPSERERMLAWVSRDQVGGLIVSTGTPAALAAKLNAAQMRAGVPLLIVSDLETGPGMRLSPGGTMMPPSMAFSAAGDTALAWQAGRATAEEARAVGIHMTLGPLFDVNSNPANPIINVRSFGESPEQVGAMGTAWMHGARAGGLLAVGKHFPGHGDTRVDSHVGLAQTGADSARLHDVEMAPFARAVRAGIDGILVGHIAAVGLEGPDAPPASLSPRMVGRELRERIGFEGLVFTDALNMGGVTRSYSVSEASIRALLAGADVLLQPPGHPTVIDDVVAAVESGRIPASRIEEAARRVLLAKAAAGLHRMARVDAGAVEGQVGTDAHRAVARRVAEASITLARDGRNLVPLRPGARVLHVTYTEAGRASAGDVLNRELAAGGLNVDHVRVGPSTPASTFASLRERAAAADVVVASVVIAPFQYRELGIRGGFGPFVEGLASAGRPVVAVSLGSPYLLESFPSVPAYLLAWSNAAVSESAAARALLGTIPIRGRLPVSLPPYHRMGEGITRGGR
ncbi:glycoside hydrolase family 3 protein [Longimicrobium sp.]|uniref:glycoside hydrolase family 3 protein n=1 Tax=Longimicrobium sp. TaxID=2029185 RepID=UPI002E3126B4|nr:glycoside hydrolase family 3 N-terminal domain-containing protein [Longimicrobium sp.]HEX6039335.1 glycoside hydrolase family 3 N-terminal domain-containing protein [Longimicrobium sp.]